jgi:hypothetical protein
VRTEIGCGMLGAGMGHVSFAAWIESEYRSWTTSRAATLSRYFSTTFRALVASRSSASSRKLVARRWLGSREPGSVR